MDDAAATAQAALVGGAVGGPHPVPMMVRDFHSVVGREAKKQFKKMTGGKLPDNLVAGVGGTALVFGTVTAPGAGVASPVRAGFV